MTPETERSPIWAARIRRLGDRLDDSRGLVVEGKLTRMVGLTLEAVGCRAAIGGRCDVINAAGDRIEAEVVGFAGESLYLMPTGDIRGLEPDARVVSGRTRWTDATALADRPTWPDLPTALRWHV